MSVGPKRCGNDNPMGMTQPRVWRSPGDGENRTEIAIEVNFSKLHAKMC